MLQGQHHTAPGFRVSPAMIAIVLWSLQLMGTANEFLGRSGLPHMLQRLQHTVKILAQSCLNSVARLDKSPHDKSPHDKSLIC